MVHRFARSVLSRGYSSAAVLRRFGYRAEIARATAVQCELLPLMCWLPEFLSLVQSDTSSHAYSVEYHYASAEAAHTEAACVAAYYRLCSELGARRVVDIGCGNGVYAASS